METPTYFGKNICRIRWVTEPTKRAAKVYRKMLKNLRLEELLTNDDKFHVNQGHVRRGRDEFIYTLKGIRCSSAHRNIKGPWYVFVTRKYYREKKRHKKVSGMRIYGGIDKKNLVHIWAKEKERYDYWYNLHLVKKPDGKEYNHLPQRCIDGTRKLLWILKQMGQYSGVHKHPKLPLVEKKIRRCDLRDMEFEFREENYLVTKASPESNLRAGDIIKRIYQGRFARVELDKPGAPTSPKDIKQLNDIVNDIYKNATVFVMRKKNVVDQDALLFKQQYMANSNDSDSSEPNRDQASAPGVRGRQSKLKRASDHLAARRLMERLLVAERELSN